MPNARGFTLVDLLATVAVALPLGAVAAVTLGPQSGVVAGSRQAKDGEQLGQIHRALAVTPSFDPKNAFPLPGRVNRKAAVDTNGKPIQVSGMGPIDEMKNSHANLWSFLIAVECLSPATLVSPLERNPKVSVVQDYAFNAYDPPADRYWDGDGPEGDGDVPASRRVTTDLAVKSCTSYATIPLDPSPRRDAEWKMSANPKFVLLGNRGPVDGDPEATIPGSDPARKNTESLSILLHGEAGRWAGFTVTGDGSTRLVRTVTPPFLAPVRTGDTTAPDNLFREDGEPRTRGDVFLAIVRRCMDREGATVSELSWD